MKLFQQLATKMWKRSWPILEARHLETIDLRLLFTSHKAF